MNKDGDSFQHISALFPFFSEAKKAGIFTGAQVRLTLQCKELEDKMTTREAETWKAFRAVIQNFPGNKRSDDYKLLVNNLMDKCENRMSHVPETVFSTLPTQFFQC